MSTDLLDTKTAPKVHHGGFFQVRDRNAPEGNGDGGTISTVFEQEATKETEKT